MKVFPKKSNMLLPLEWTYKLLFKGGIGEQLQWGSGPARTQAFGIVLSNVTSLVK